MFSIDEQYIKIIKKYIESFKSTQPQKKANSQSKEGKALILIGDDESDTMIIRDYLLGQLKTEMNLDIQKVSGSIKRTAQYFKSSIFEGTQHSSVEKGFQSLFGS